MLLCLHPGVCLAPDLLHLFSSHAPFPLLQAPLPEQPVPGAVAAPLGRAVRQGAAGARISAYFACNFTSAQHELPPADAEGV